MNDIFYAYPNPSKANENITIEIPNGQTNLKMSLTDVAGNKLFSNTINQNGQTNKVSIPLAQMNLPRGIYFVTISNTNLSQCKKIIID